MTAAAGRSPSVSGTWIAAMLRALDARGVDGAELARTAGMNPAALTDPDARVSRESLTRLWGLAVAATGDPCFGLTIPRYLTPTSFHALGYAVLASATLKEALERIIRYRRLIGDIVQLSLIEMEDRYRFAIDVSAPPGVPFESVDAFSAVLIGQARLTCHDRNLRPLAVLLERPQPPDPTPFRQVFHVDVQFGQQLNAIDFARADLERRLPAANAELARQNEQVIVAYLARAEKARLASRVEAAVLRALPDGSPSKQAIARELGMSGRNLQRHLAEDGDSFKEIVERARANLARSYVVEGRLTMTEIAFMLGFADTSVFSRAFKRWTGRSPRDYQRRPDGAAAPTAS